MEQDYHLNLALKHLGGELSEAEEAELQRWLDASAENRAQMAEWEAAWAAAETLHAAPEVDLDAAFAELEDRMDNAEPESEPLRAPRPKRRKPRMPYLAVAASVMLVTSLLILYYFLRGEVEPLRTEVYAASQDTNFSLPDQSHVVLKAGSRLSYPAEFAEGARDLDLDGAAYFEVTPDPARPFTVKAEDLSVRVLGTRFGLNGKMDSASSTFPQIMVFEGKVQVNYGKHSPDTLLAGEHHVYGTPNQRKLNPLYVHDSYWKKGQIEFQNAELSTVLRGIGILHKMPIQIMPGVDCRITASFEHMSPEEMWEELKIIARLKLHHGGGKVTILGAEC